MASLSGMNIRCKAAAAALLAAASCAPPPAAKPAPRAPAPAARAVTSENGAIEALGWLTGAWSSPSDGTEEHWTAPRGGTMLGMNRTVRNGRTVHYEHLKIEARPDGVYYVASPSGQATAEFRLESSSAEDMVAVFANEARTEFPQRIVYRREGARLHARVSGPGDRASEWTWSRAGEPPRRKARPSTAPAIAWLDDGLSFDAEWPKGDPAALGFDVHALADIVREAERTKSDSLLVMKDGKLVVERYFGKPEGPIETMSATKSIVSIVVGLLIADKKIASIDAPLSTWFPEWRTGPKAKVTLRHVLTHTSGLEHRQGAAVLNKERDRLAFVRKSAVVEEPGMRFSYSNEAVQLLAGVVRKAAGKDLDAYAAEKLFAPLGITDYRWDRDDAGNVQAFYGLALSARDLARIGRLMLQRGEWKGERLVPAEWIDASTSPGGGAPYHGLLWWIRRGAGQVELSGERLASLASRGFGELAALRPLVGQPFSSPAAFWMHLGAHLSEAGRAELAAMTSNGTTLLDEKTGPIIGYAADGWLGQHLIVFPERGLVAVRQHRAPEDGSADDAYNKKHGFFDLPRRLDLALREP